MIKHFALLRLSSLWFISRKMFVIVISSGSEEEVTFVVRCSKPSCRFERRDYYLMHKTKQIMSELDEFDSESSDGSTGSNRSTLNSWMVKDKYSNQEGENLEPEAPYDWVKLEVLNSHSRYVIEESVMKI